MCCADFSDYWPEQILPIIIMSGTELKWLDEKKLKISLKLILLIKWPIWLKNIAQGQDAGEKKLIMIVCLAEKLVIKYFLVDFFLAL